MKRLSFVIPVMLFVSFAACHKVKGPANGHSVKPVIYDSMVSMNAFINGHYWQTDSAFGSYIMHSGNDSGIINLLITATRKVSDSTSTIVLNISNFTGPKTYPILPPLNTATYYWGNARHFATSGVIVITSDTAYALIGTFQFTADSVTVSNGVFNVALPSF